MGSTDLSYQHGREPLRNALTAAAFWTLAVLALINLRDLHLWESSQVEVLVARATMVSCALLLGLVGIWCVVAWRRSGSLAPVRRTLGGTPGILLFAGVASYLAIGTAMLDVEAQGPDRAGHLRYYVLYFGVLVAAAVGSRAMLERTGPQRLLRGLLVVLIFGCAIILASPLLRDLGILPPYRLPFRLSGAFVDPNDASLPACMTAALAMALLIHGGSRKLGWLGLAAGVAASLATASRTALVVLGVLMVVFAGINFRSKRSTFVPVLALALFVVAGFIGVTFISGGLIQWSSLRSSPAAPQEVGTSCDLSPTHSASADCAVLLAIRDALAGDVALNWSGAVPLHRWQGVTMDGPDNRATQLHLRGLGLNGRIPPELGNLDRLVHLSLGRNRLTGSIPPELGNLASLQTLNLSHNDLTGTIPPELALLPQLRRLALRDNRLAGPVPAALGDLELQVLRLAGNDIHSVPAGLATDHDLATMRVCAPLPATNTALFNDCTALLEVKDALAADVPLNWHAEVPIGRWQGVAVGGPQERVVELDLYEKGLRGHLPPELGRLDGLVALNLAANRLTGPIPPELGRLVNLRHLSLDRNALTGTIPAELGQLGQLESLWLRDNHFRGPVAPAVIQIPDHDLSHLKLCQQPPPPVPTLFEDCTLLLAVKETLAGKAELNWHAARPITEWQGVVVGGTPSRVIALNLESMGLAGRIPPQLGSLPGLQWLNLSGNRLTGSVPPELGQLVPGHSMFLDGNALTHPVPQEPFDVYARRIPRDTSTEFSDRPARPATASTTVVCRLPPLSSFELFDDCRRLLAMKDMLAGSAWLNWSATLPLREWRGVAVGGPESRVVRLELPRMGLNGRVPAALGQLAGLRSLVLDGNQLIGAIPPELGKLRDLEILGLAGNALTGRIPQELAALSSLKELWLGGNRLTGDSLPPELRSVAGREAPCPAAPADNPGLRADCAVLLAARDVLAGTGRLNWSERIPIEFWQGVTVGSSLGRVTQLELPDSSLNGRIPPVLGRLHQLVSLDLSRNRLTGPLPPELGELTNLENLWLSSNALRGPIPPELGKLRNLKELRLWNKRLSGGVPVQLDDFVMLDSVQNRPSFGDPKTPAVASHDASEDRPGAVRRLFCRRSPPFPVTASLHADCALLLASRDLLAGEASLNWSEDIPIEFWRGVTVSGAPPRVTALELPRAGLNGRLFAELGDLRGLVALNLSHNRLAGPIPPALGGLEHLVSLRLEGNRLAGPVPPELEGLDNLAFLSLADNDLDRPFPPALHEIDDHDLDAPVFCRPMKIDPGLLADCTLLLAVRDVLAGDAPLNWSEAVPVDDWLGVVMDRSRGRVTALDLTQMGLNGRIPAELGQLGGLVSLRLGRNRLAGSIPPELGSLGALRILALDGNLLAGSIPPELGQLSSLVDLWLQGNRLIGPLPPAVAALPRLTLLRLDDAAAAEPPPAPDTRVGHGRFRNRNLFCRPSHATIWPLQGDCTTLLAVRDVLAGDVALNWSDEVPIDYWRGVTVGPSSFTNDSTSDSQRIIVLDLSHAGLNGRIPPELAALDALAVLWLGHNRLAGAIPPELGALTELRTLSLENNALTGPIPWELGMLRQLVSLRLGNNELAGRMKWFTNLANLRTFAVENAGLRGEIDPQIGTLQHLEELRLDNNRLHGNIPKALEGLNRLVILRLGGNAFPYCVRTTSPLAQVRDNDLESADLLCETPPWSKLDLFEDGARLMQMRDTLAGDAVLNWSYTRPVASWQGVKVGTSGRIVSLDLRDMNLTGRIPAELSELSHLNAVRLSGNRLTGAIPPELGKSPRLTILSAGGNLLAGPIPPEIGNLLTLRQLWLADNRLTAPIPIELATVPRLSLAVAGNDFRNCTHYELQHLRSHDFDERAICAAADLAREGAADRLLLWKLGFEKAMEAPLLGHGFGALASMDGAPFGNDGRPLGPHNLYLTLLGEAGVVPLLLFVSAIVLLLRAQWAAPKSVARDATVACVVVIALYSMSFEHLLGLGAFMFLAGVSIATGMAYDDDHPHVARA